MKKLMIFLSVLLLINRTYAQKQYYLTPVKLDSSVAVSLPKEFSKNAATGQQSFVANGVYGSFLVIRSVNPPGGKTVKNTNGLDNVFQEYIKKVQTSSGNGTVVNVRDTTMGKLAVCDFILQTDTGSGVQLRHFKLLYTKNTTYTFEYLYDDFRKDEADGEMKAFFSSIKTAPDLDRDDQYIVTAQSSQPIIVKIILFGLIPLAIIIAVIVFLRRRDTMTLT
ncbi:hypothetical protein BDD43_2511 [Mucilaginibacter gracilis]|uniref:Uncharacterized protein n=1 Tax=Mucilaginibacter gracilis TaxID=423350 RepID=A0A495J035_9SPHI|nr:hypothetical protein [Mucilaginibacter gracilis]RKR82335.1 hypothetical protein BDD43_2511 [Mucilaginibacter gracilis]